MTQHESTANQAPRPREVQWEEQNTLFEDVSGLRAALAGDVPYKVYGGLKRAYSVDGEGVSGFPETKTAMLLPSGHTVAVDVYAATGDWVRMNSESDADYCSPWGSTYDMSDPMSDDMVLLILRASWHGNQGMPPLFTATVSAQGHDEPFKATNWTLLTERETFLDEGQQTFVGGVEPANTPVDSIATVILPWSADFVEGLQIAFHEPQKLDRRG